MVTGTRAMRPHLTISSPAALTNSRLVAGLVYGRYSPPRSTMARTHAAIWLMTCLLVTDAHPEKTLLVLISIVSRTHRFRWPNLQCSWSLERSADGSSRIRHATVQTVAAIVSILAVGSKCTVNPSILRFIKYLRQLLAYLLTSSKNDKMSSYLDPLVLCTILYAKFMHWRCPVNSTSVRCTRVQGGPKSKPLPNDKKSY